MHVSGTTRRAACGVTVKKRRARMGPVMGRRETRRRGATGCSRAIPAMRRGMRSSAKGISDTPQSIHALRDGCEVAADGLARDSLESKQVDGEDNDHG